MVMKIIPHFTFHITYDEHGGSYDHVPPPLAVSPDEKPTQPFRFNRYGVRVPNIFISPWIKPGTILRVVPDGNLPHNGPPYPFDHTSILATISKCFNLKDKPLTNRVAVAPDFEGVLNLKKPDNNPPPLEQPAFKLNHDDLDVLLDAPMNSFQQALYELAGYLPSTNGQAKDSEQFLAKIKDHLKDLKNKKIKPDNPKHSTPREALPFIQKKIKDFLGE